MCERGTFASAPATTMCKACREGAISVGGATACIVCVAGSYVAASDTCAKCSPGTYSLVAATACKACERGTFAHKEGEVACTNCTLGTFASEAAQSSCNVCPPYTTTKARGAVSPLQCRCLPGASCSYWQEEYLVQAFPNVTAAQLLALNLSQTLGYDVLDVLF